MLITSLGRFKTIKKKINITLNVYQNESSYSIGGMLNTNILHHEVSFLLLKEIA